MSLKNNNLKGELSASPSNPSDKLTISFGWGNVTFCVTLGVTAIGTYLITKKLPNHWKSKDKIEEGHNRAKDTMKVDDNKSRNRQKETKNRSECRKQEMEQQGEIDLKKIEKNGEIKIQMLQVAKDTKIEGKITTAAIDIIKKEILHEQRANGFKPVVTQTDLTRYNDLWIRSFNTRYKKPVMLPKCISPIIKACPRDYDIPMLFMLLCAFGTYCFPQVRAIGLDGKKQRILLQIMTEGESGSGKGKFKDVFDRVFKEVIEVGERKENRIIQTLGIGISISEFVNILANNKGIPCFILDTEVASLKAAFRNRSSIFSPEVLRKAFDGDEISQFNKDHKKSAQGNFPVLLNYVILGTPQALSKAFREDDVEGGSTNRIMWSVIPSIHKKPTKMKPIDDKVMKLLHKQIDEWRERYGYYTTEVEDDADGGKGTKMKDIVAEETIIDLPSVRKALVKWMNEQNRLDNDDARNKLLGRISTIAFRCAMVFYMLWNCPKDKETMKCICEWTRYIANYCMERYLFKFGSNRCKAYFEVRGIPTENEAAPVFTNELKRQIYERWRTSPSDNRGNRVFGLRTLAKKYHTTKERIRDIIKEIDNIT